MRIPAPNLRGMVSLLPRRGAMTAGACAIRPKEGGPRPSKRGLRNRAEATPFPMRRRARHARSLALVAPLVLAFCSASPAGAAGVTIITHGFNSEVTSWIIPMAGKVGGYPSFPGATYSCYEISITKNGSGQFLYSATFLGGAAPLTTDSGEIVVKLDWSTLSSGGASSTNIAQAAANAVLATNLIPEMGGHPLAEMPLHLIGHSRGGSVVTEMARLLGAQGVWVDHVTTLDPVPVSLYGDASVTSWANVLYADNFWQTIGGFLIPTGQSVFGAYNRKLLNLNEGYSSPHSDVHLWYHGTIDLVTPATDTQANITASQRGAWWSATEMSGASAGFRYSLIGGGDRLSSEPADAGNGRISDGFNKNWDLGGGLASNRAALPANAGLWPNPLRVTLASTPTIPAGASFDVALRHQAGAGASGSIAVAILLDSDTNPYNGNELVVSQTTLPKTGIGAVSLAALSATVGAASVLPGTYAICVRLNDGTRTRYLYAPEALVVTPSVQAPTIDATSLALAGGVMRFKVRAFPGQVVTVVASGDLASWIPLQTFTSTGAAWDFADAGSGTVARRFYRAILAP
jgi:hypothetical protein